MTARQQSAATLVIAAALAAIVWTLSTTITGLSEPWDSESPYYVGGLAVAGAISGAISAKPLWAHYIGAIVGQALYMLVFLPLGPLVVLGLGFMAAFSAIFMGAAAGGAALRERFGGR